MPWSSICKSLLHKPLTPNGMYTRRFRHLSARDATRRNAGLTWRPICYVVTLVPIWRLMPVCQASTNWSSIKTEHIRDWRHDTGLTGRRLVLLHICTVTNLIRIQSLHRKSHSPTTFHEIRFTTYNITDLEAIQKLRHAPRWGRKTVTVWQCESTIALRHTRHHQTLSVIMLYCCELCRVFWSILSM